MFTKLAAALVAATVLTVPALAQSTAPVKTDAAPAATTSATTTPAAPKVVAAKPTLKHAKVTHRRHVAHHVKPVKHAKLVKHAKHVKIVKHAKHVKFVKAKHHQVAKMTKKRTTTYMRAAPSTHPVVLKSKKPVKHTVKTTHRVNHVRVTEKSTTPARPDAPAAPKSVN
jgi:hypothetical protein